MAHSGVLRRMLSAMTSTAQPDQLISPARVAILCRVSTRTVARWAADGLITRHGSGPGTRYSAMDVMPLIRSRMHGSNAR